MQLPQVCSSEWAERCAPAAKILETSMARMEIIHPSSSSNQQQLDERATQASKPLLLTRNDSDSEPRGLWQRSGALRNHSASTKIRGQPCLDFVHVPAVAVAAPQSRPDVAANRSPQVWERHHYRRPLARKCWSTTASTIEASAGVIHERRDVLATTSY